MILPAFRLAWPSTDGASFHATAHAFASQEAALTASRTLNRVRTLRNQAPYSHIEKQDGEHWELTEIRVSTP